jgi:hypothetical protein
VLLELLKVGLELFFEICCDVPDSKFGRGADVCCIARTRREASAGADIQMRSVRRKPTLSAGAKKRQASYPDFNILGDRHCTGNDRVDVRMQGHVFF